VNQTTADNSDFGPDPHGRGSTHQWRYGRERRRHQAVRPPPRAFLDERGRACLLVPLDREGRGLAIVEERDYLAVRAMGATGVWLANANTKRSRRYVRTSVPTGPQTATNVQVARLIVGAGPGTVVRYLNGNPLDLRRENLTWQRGQSKRDDALIAQRGTEFRVARAAEILA